MSQIPTTEWSISEGTNEEEMRGHVLIYLLNRQKDMATELIVKFIKMKEHIHTTRDDENAEMWIYKDGIYISEAKTYIIETVRKILDDAFTTFFANQVIAKIQADTYIAQDDFFNTDYPYLIAVKNGILNLKTKELQDFTPELKFFNKVPIAYDPEKQCPNINSFLTEVLAKPEDIQIIEELFGYLLYDDYFIEKAVMFYGGGRNGKGKTLSLMKAFLGADNCTEIPLETLEKDYFSLSEM